MKWAEFLERGNPSDLRADKVCGFPRPVAEIDAEMKQVESGNYGPPRGCVGVINKFFIDSCSTALIIGGNNTLHASHQNGAPWRVTFFWSAGS
jgi:hypothetical protein